MTTFTVSVSESTNVFGGAPTDLWNSYAWNAFIWGEGTAPAPIGIFSGVSEAETPSDSFVNRLDVGVEESQASLSSMPSGYIRDATGFYHVFPDPSTNGEERASPTWAEPTAATPTWTSATVSAPSWS